MFHINILAVGKNKDHWIDEAISHYLLLLKKYAHINLIYISDVKSAGNLSDQELKFKEAALVKTHLKSAYQIALSNRGHQYDSVQFARFLEKLMQRTGDCDFLIGGIFGLDESILGQSHQILSLSPLTFSHQLVRPILLEQLYRAYTIISGGKYHK